MGMKKGAFKKSERLMGECACVAGICQSTKHTYEKRLVSFETSLFSRVPCGGDKRDRTADLLNAMQTREKEPSQNLEYITVLELVNVGRFEQLNGL